MNISLNVLYNVLLKSTILMSPFTPFISDLIFGNLRRVLDPKSIYYQESVHFVDIPIPNEALLDKKIE